MLVKSKAVVGLICLCLCLCLYFIRQYKVEKEGCVLYWMPYCSYGQEAAKTLLKATNGKVKFCYIAKEYLNSAHSKLGDLPSVSAATGASGCRQDFNGKPDFGNFGSLHGKQETEESIRQLVIAKKWPDAFLPYLRSFLEKPDNDWQNRAEKAHISCDQLSSLVTSRTAARWFSRNIREAVGITFSPTIVLNGHQLKTIPKSENEMRMELCSSGVVNTGCEGFFCTAKQPCPAKQGYLSECRHGRCLYKVEPLRTDAVNGYLVVPENCIPSESYPVEEALKGWSSYLKITRIPLSEMKAQELLRGCNISSFPVLVCDEILLQREWGKRCIQELNLAQHDHEWIAAFDYSSAPFSTYATIIRNSTGLYVTANHFAGALFLHQIGRLDAAAKSYRLSLEENPNDYRAWNNLGAILYDQQGLKESGRILFKKALELNSTYEPALLNLLRFQTEAHDTPGILSTKERLGWLVLENRHWKDAAAYFEQVVSDKNYEFSARKGLAFIAIQESRPKDALRELKRCLEIDPRPDGDFANLLAGVYYRLGEQEAAIEWYEMALIDPASQNKTYANLCFLLNATERWEKLLVVSAEACKKNPDDPSFGFHQAAALSHVKRTDEAIQLLQQLSHSCEEAKFRSSYELARLYYSSGDPKTAAGYAACFLEFVAAQRRSQLIEQCTEIGNLAIEAGNDQLAIKAFEQVLRTKPSDFTAHKKLATCYKNLGELDRSREQIILTKQFGGEGK